MTNDEADRRAREITRLVKSGEEGLLAAMYQELRDVAGRRMAREREDHTLQATALVHEVYLRLSDDEALDWSDRGQFFGAASEAMRRVLVDHARRVASLRRGEGRERVTLGGVDTGEGELDVEELLALSEAIERLEEEDPDAVQVVKLRYFGGLTAAETAEALGRSERSVHREWSFARARLRQMLDGAD